MSVRIVCLAWFAIGFVLAQDLPQDTPAGDEQELRPQPSQVADAGPSLLGLNATSHRRGKLLDVRWYGEILGVYDSGLVPTAAPGSGSPAAAYGLESGLGASISKQWKHSRLTIEYRGLFRHYTNLASFNGADQYLNIVYHDQLLRHLALNLNETAGTTTIANGAFAYLPISNSDLFALPTNELFDIRTNYLESNVDLIWDPTARFSFDIGGEGFLVRRASFALAGLNGYRARALAACRLTPLQAIFSAYEHIYFDFQHAFGGATLETATLGYAVRLTRSLDFTVQAGGSRVGALGLRQITIDPALAAIIGRNSALVVQHHTVYVPSFEAQLIQRFNRATLRAALSHGVSPGNGLFLTSRQTTANVGYSYTGSRGLTFRANAGYNQLSTLDQAMGSYRHVDGGGGVTYRLVRDTHLEFRYDFRHYTTQESFYRINSSRITLGLAYGSGDAPPQVW